MRFPDIKGSPSAIDKGKTGTEKRAKRVSPWFEIIAESVLKEEKGFVGVKVIFHICRSNVKGIQ